MQSTEQSLFEKYGAGAESKMRLEEGSNASYRKANAPYYANPISEGRMRSQEQTRFITPEVIKSQEFERRHSKPIQEKRPNINVQSITSKSLPTSNAKSVAVNPFDDDDESNIDYDESKNPFADDAIGESLKPDIAKEASNNDKQTTNPFGEYDNNLNPFESNQS